MQFSGKQLPDWGFNQHEIVTDRVIHQDDTIWNVEEHRYTKSNTELFFSVIYLFIYHYSFGTCVVCSCDKITYCFQSMEKQAKSPN